MSENNSALGALITTTEEIMDAPACCQPTNDDVAEATQAAAPIVCALIAERARLKVSGQRPRLLTAADIAEEAVEILAHMAALTASNMVALATAVHDDDD